MLDDCSILCTYNQIFFFVSLGYLVNVIQLPSEKVLIRAPLVPLLPADRVLQRLPPRLWPLKAGGGRGPPAPAPAKNVGGVVRVVAHDVEGLHPNNKQEE